MADKYRNEKIKGNVRPVGNNEPRHEKNNGFLHKNYAKTKSQISFAVTAQLISAFVFAT